MSVNFNCNVADADRQLLEKIMRVLEKRIESFVYETESFKDEEKEV